MYLGLSVILTSYVLPTILRLSDFFPDNDSSLLLPILIFSQITTGFGMAIMAVGSGSILADIADDQELQTGKRQEGLIFFYLFRPESNIGCRTFLCRSRSLSDIVSYGKKRSAC